MCKTVIIHPSQLLSDSVAFRLRFSRVPPPRFEPMPPACQSDALSIEPLSLSIHFTISVIQMKHAYIARAITSHSSILFAGSDSNKIRKRPSRSEVKRIEARPGSIRPSLTYEIGLFPLHHGIILLKHEF